MANPAWSFEKVRDAALQLPLSERRKLVECLNDRPSPEEVLKLAARMRGSFRLPPSQQKRLSLLLQKGNAGELTSKQRKELDALIEAVLDKREELAKAVGEVLDNRRRTKSRNGMAGH
jgi:hypothetical protein